MPIKCNNPDMLITFVKQKHPQAEFSNPTHLQTKISFPCGLVMNIFNTGTVNFQGNSHENRIAADLLNVIDAINR
ncbi:conserved hypothetical protein [Paraburkholderia piptadeniae]|uniref:Uncharacterized protein n=2 Tax=Paraburkholderia TaxID=1822464 RepID=A0A7X1NKZ7_9BURK|nr:hypothetical protein [Paraburkholderia franconis]SIT52132.1 conserved hypothetical protein [Paraburkholderia piptadeniae]